MQSRKSCFNATLFKKNLTRFAPMWGLYTLCLILGTLLVYNNGGTMKQWHFANNMAQMPQILSLINLLYAPVVAQLLFGDLFNSRMCNALHAMPVRRETLFVTNILSGLTFSVLPGTVMAVMSTLLCGGSLIQSAWQLPWLTLAASTMEFVCFYGISVFAVMCSGNRLGMLLIYGLLNGGAFIAYWLVDTVYTPMLYGVITPTALSEALTPMANMMDNPFMEVEHTLWELRELFGEDLEGAFAVYRLVPETWGNLLRWTAAGAGFAGIGLVLYKKRSLECAGDALAFRILEPVFQVVVAVVSGCFCQMFVDLFIGDTGMIYVFLTFGLVVGWFGCRMFIEHSTRVFRMKTVAGLLGLTGVLALSLMATHWDVFGIETWQPDAEDIASISFGNYGDAIELTEEEEFRRILALQEDALVDRLTYDGPYVEGLDGSWVYNIDSNAALIGREQDQITDCRFAFDVRITYTLKSGKVIARRYTLWADGESGDTAREYLSDWDRCINADDADGYYTAQVIRNPESLYVDGVTEIKDPEQSLVTGLVEAVMQDCREGNMAQNAFLHTGYFYRPYEQEPGKVERTHSIGIQISGERHGWWINVYPDSVHTVRFLRENGLLAYSIAENNLHYN